jgi:radical SAM protein with 4Fe4S-binding SPASM domain
MAAQVGGGSSIVDKNDAIAFSGFHPDQSELERYFRESRVYSIQIESNLLCRQGCLYCYASSNQFQDRELPDKIVKSVLDSAKAMDIRAVDWLGGDPLERNGWFELMKYSSKLGLKNNIWTSGLPLADQDIAEKAMKVADGGFISVHLDSLNENLYGQLHSGNPAEKIRTILRGVDNIQRLGKNPDEMFNCITFTKPLAGDDVGRTIKHFFEEKGMRTCLTQMCSVGSALEHPEWLPTLDEIRSAVSVRDTINYSDSPITMSTMDANKFYCGGAICITIDGDVTPCSVVRKNFGNVHKQSLNVIIENNTDDLLHTRLREPENLPGNCKTCRNNSVCWGCRAMAYYETGDLIAMDPKCTFS